MKSFKWISVRMAGRRNSNIPELIENRERRRRENITAVQEIINEPRAGPSNSRPPSAASTISSGRSTPIDPSDITYHPPQGLNITAHSPPTTRGRMAGIPEVSQSADPTLKEAPGVAAASGDSTNPGFQYMKRPRQRHHETRTFKNMFVCNTWGYAYAFNGKDQTTYNKLMTPLAAVPANQLSLYMARSEYDLLPSGSRAVSCRVKITPKGFRTSFATQQATSSYSNSNHTLFGVHAIGLNTSHFGKIYEVAGRNATKPMIVTQTKDCDFESFKKIMWGKEPPITKDTTIKSELPMCIGVHRSLPYYWNMHQYQVQDGTNLNPARCNKNLGWPFLRETMTEWDFAGHVNKPVVDYSYNFNHGLIKSRDGFFAMDEDGTSTFGILSNQQLYAQTYITDKNGQMVSNIGSSVPKKRQLISGYDLEIEKPFCGQWAKVYGDMQRQPLPFIGIQPILANHPGVAELDYTNCQATWLIETELVVDMYAENSFTYSNLLWPWKAQNIGTGPYRTDTIMNIENKDGRYPLLDVQQQPYNHADFERIHRAVGVLQQTVTKLKNPSTGTKRKANVDDVAQESALSQFSQDEIPSAQPQIRRVDTSSNIGKAGSSSNPYKPNYWPRDQPESDSDDFMDKVAGDFEEENASDTEDIIREMDKEEKLKAIATLEAAKVAKQVEEQKIDSEIGFINTVMGIGTNQNVTINKPIGNSGGSSTQLKNNLPIPIDIPPPIFEQKEL